jgi:regulatory protein
MKIVKIDKKGSSCIVRFEDKSRIKFSESLLIDTGLQVGDDLTSEEFQEVALKSEIEAAEHSALRLLSRRSHSTTEIKRKLRLRGFGIDVIEPVIEDLLKKNYLNDDKFVDEYIASKISTRKDGPNKIKAMLMSKGLERDLIENSLLKIPPDETLENALSVARKKLRTIPEELEWSEKKLRIQRYLYRKGFGKKDIDSVVNNLENNLN